ncbi:unnamed protein product [Heligmosomoides polygyrus]|uniref:Secreted protein n=1 Tax=Heligmosomoides polygyrus TaxID=6339 RepID=A0A183GQY2_HELPZ|nr:unnamed protein product [Heligmosomoides polygyrus]
MSFSPARVVSIVLAEFEVPGDNDAPTVRRRRPLDGSQLFYVLQLQLTSKRMEIWHQMCVLMTSSIGTIAMTRAKKTRAPPISMLFTLTPIFLPGLLRGFDF